MTLDQLEEFERKKEKISQDILRRMKAEAAKSKPKPDWEFVTHGTDRLRYQRGYLIRVQGCGVVYVEDEPNTRG